MGWRFGHVVVMAAEVVWGMLGLGGWVRLRVVGGWVWGLWWLCLLVVETVGLVGCKWGRKGGACARGGMRVVGWVGRVGLVRLVWLCVVVWVRLAWWCVVVFWVGCRRAVLRSACVWLHVVVESWVVEVLLCCSWLAWS